MEYGDLIPIPNMTSAKVYAFPNNFFWGAATSSYQVEGNNKASDWWEWEQKGKLKHKSGLACRHYELFKNDFDLAKSLNHNAHRMSIEWSRIEPIEGEFSSNEIKHYVDVINALKERNIEPVVTLHHFTNPAWFTQKGGWLRKDAPEYFLRYIQKIVPALCEKVRVWITIDEPMVYTYYAYVTGIWPPQEKSLSNLKKVSESLMSAHIKTHRFIHDIYKKRNFLSPYVSIAKHMQVFEPAKNTLKNKLAARLRERLFNFNIIDRLFHEKTLDFIGLNYYTRNLVDVKSWGIKHLLTDMSKKSTQGIKKNSLGWDIYPQGLYKICLKLKRYNLPVFILENGICTSDDNSRWDFIQEHLKALYMAMQAGVKILGYFYWSLLDNYEWHEGFDARFGLIEVDYGTHKRTVRESAKKFAQVCKNSKLQ